jgi:hypothetical protein
MPIMGDPMFNPPELVPPDEMRGGPGYPVYNPYPQPEPYPEPDGFRYDFPNGRMPNIMDEYFKSGQDPNFDPFRTDPVATPDFNLFTPSQPLATAVNGGVTGQRGQLPRDQFGQLQSRLDTARRFMQPGGQPRDQFGQLTQPRIRPTRGGPQR